MAFPAPLPWTDLQAVLFDLDGTLVHTRIDFPAMRETILAVIRSFGVPSEPYTALDSLTAIEQVAERVPAPDAFRAACEAALVEIELVACEGAEEAVGAIATLDWLRETGHRVGIVTRNSPQAVGRILEQFPFAHDVLLTRADVPRVKPDPIHLWMALEQIQADPEQSLMVGDHTMDVLGGKRAGMRTLGILNGERPAGFFASADPDGVIPLLPDLRRWISPSSW